MIFSLLIQVERELCLREQREGCVIHLQLIHFLSVVLKGQPEQSMAFKLFFLPAEPHLLFTNNSLLQIPRLKQAKVHGVASLPRRPLSHSANLRNSWRPLTTYRSLMNIHENVLVKYNESRKTPWGSPRSAIIYFLLPPPHHLGNGELYCTEDCITGVSLSSFTSPLGSFQHRICFNTSLP